MGKMWLIRRYKLLWKNFGTEKFGFEDATKILKEDEKFVSVVLSELRKVGWVAVELDQEDARKRRYKLKSISEVKNQVIEAAFGDEDKGVKVGVGSD